MIYQQCFVLLMSQELMAIVRKYTATQHNRVTLLIEQQNQRYRIAFQLLM